MKKIKYVLFLLMLMVVFSSLVYAGGGHSMSGKSKEYAGKSDPVKDSQSSVEGDRVGSYRQGPPAKECLGFFEETSGLRKEFANRRMALTKAEEDPKTDPQDIVIRKKKIHDMFRTIEEKNTQNCRWVY